MCGIAGVWSNDRNYRDRIREFIGAAVLSLLHRGPDGNGQFVSDDIALGHTRLSIIDVSAAASQPMLSNDGKHAIVFNGEIYNFRSLYLRYCPQDGSVNGNSDTAVLLYLLSKFGADCVSWLDGMFAFAHVDLESKQFLLARDRFGEKPLYFRFDQDHFAFASEIKALRQLLPEKPWSLNPEAIALFHVMGSVAPPQTIFQDVYALQPGRTMTFNPGHPIREEQYWSLSELQLDADQSTEASLATPVTRALLMSAVRSRLVSDVPVGLFLSGGFDSSALMACCAALGHPQTLAVCIDFEEKGFSEYSKALTVARHYGATVHRHVVTQDSFESKLNDFFNCMDQPTGDGYNTFFVCNAAKDFGIKAWLSGVGGDELFGGYQSFQRLGPWSTTSKFLQAAINPSLLDRLTPYLGERLKLSRILHMSDKGSPKLRAYQACRNSVPWRNARQILSSSNRIKANLSSSAVDARYPATKDEFDNFQQATVFESSVYMRAQLLRDIDNFSMRHSLELRAPFLESRLFEAVFSMGSAVKKRGRTIKPLLGTSVPIAFPREILLQSKQGFGFPVDAWLRKGLEKWFLEAIDSVRQYDLWDDNEIKRLWGAYQCRAVHWSILWNIFAMAKWVSINLEKR